MRQTGRAVTNQPADRAIREEKKELPEKKYKLEEKEKEKEVEEKEAVTTTLRPMRGWDTKQRGKGRCPSNAPNQQHYTTLHCTTRTDETPSSNKNIKRNLLSHPLNKDKIWRRRCGREGDDGRRAVGNK